MIYDLPLHASVLASALSEAIRQFTAREKAMGYYGDSGSVIVLKETLERLEKEYL